MKIIPNYHPPSDYRRPTKTQEKVYVPVNDYPEINFSTITNPILTRFLLSTFLLGDACGIPWRMQHLSSLTLKYHTTYHTFELQRLTPSLYYS